ncbi:DNA oxidative demethylase ALKBH2 isoform X1 [Ricinus communis]|uniref:DNA oxidative demethylase ALKBH2 isoform X1 n=1 Tax=Ricinus communis TaxID=3988 RepID=UPI00201AE6D4|nr:DNA oxidative demethylase ALKBH2 isoform X1 [Ricinus communis]XP_048226088.1 DNA oxidative demethylase ALKBH2 isoform X1 [Ricinus communis]XP_048226089.1 DNA oxidative demethylase ALKBH2 isoform X1 [Ricinus communis]XP_048226090.1 DNA oxidative demethylase ALKBH2 isoform X1 [Ricinus communis]XP_048226091.1 DNA oxidative demethylase ALKBH2 isoform X1 [Ricinus communis]XP_048226092.1 DNA oxidative demethylase ALKBH2 isoform X1 [Ricinus communis]XP_048226093.1 DNA oxidative demethylase ALKBH2
MSSKFKPVSQPRNPKANGGDEKEKQVKTLDLGNGSEVLYIPRFLSFDDSWEFFNYLDSHIPWTRPTLRIFGRSCVQPRDTCYVASPGLPELIYSGYKPHVYSWDDYPPLKDILEAVHRALPGSRFNSLLLNRYKGGNDNVGWHADDEKLYGPTPEIASVSFGCEREFLLKKRQSKSKAAERRCDDEPDRKRLKKSSHVDQHSFTLKHGSLLVMKGNTQRDWLHSVPKRAKAEATRINLTFRHVL